jgi:hypothetical protein
MKINQVVIQLASGGQWMVQALRNIVICKIWGFHGSGYEECRLLGYKNPVRTSQETHYVSTTEPSQLMLCKICGFHGGDYEESRLLGYKTPVCTSQGTDFVSTTEPSQLMLFKIWGLHGGHYKECRLLWCYTVWDKNSLFNRSRRLLCSQDANITYLRGHSNHIHSLLLYEWFKAIFSLILRSFKIIHITQTLNWIWIRHYSCFLHEINISSIPLFSYLITPKIMHKPQE